MDHARAIDPDYAPVSPMRAPVFCFRQRAGIVKALKAARGEPVVLVAGNQAPYLWLNVQVPENAEWMAFDFTVTSDPREDRIVCAINETKVFSLAGKFAPSGAPSSTELIDLSAYASQSVELFLG